MSDLAVFSFAAMLDGVMALNQRFQREWREIEAGIKAEREHKPAEFLRHHGTVRLNIGRMTGNTYFIAKATVQG